MLDISKEETYTDIVEQFSDMIYRIAWQNLFNREDSEDVVQDVFLKLLQQKNNIFRDPEHLKAWLIRVTVNRCLDFKKSFLYRKIVPLDNIDKLCSTGISWEDGEQKIMEELYQLPEETRNILYLYYYEGYTIREIADILGKKQNTVNSKLTRGRKKLKQILEVPSHDRTKR